MVTLITNKWVLDNIDTVIFDKDGTFIDLHYFWGKMTELRVLEIIKRYNLESSFYYQICKDLGYDSRSGKMFENGITALYSRVEIVRILSKKLEKYGIKISCDDIADIFDDVSEIFYLNMHNYTKPIYSAINFIKKLYNKGVNLGIVTSDSLVSTKKTLRYYDWEYLFSIIVGRESTNDTKESGIPTLLAIKELGVDVDRALMIGDAPTDYISAKNAGINNIILTATGQICYENLQSITPFVVSSLEEVEVV